MEFKVGDKVTTDPKGDFGINDEMRVFAKDKTIGIIKSINDSYHDYKEIRVEFPDGDIWIYSARELKLAPESPKSFTKADLKNGMLVQIRRGDWYMVMFGATIGYETKDILLNLENGFLNISEYTNDLKDIDGINKWDIIKIATVDSPVSIFNMLRKGTSVKSIDGFKIIFDRTKEELQESIASLKSQIAAKEAKLEELA